MPRSSNTAPWVARMRPLLGTLVEIRASGSSLRVADAIAAAFAAIERVQRLMSFHDERSDVSRINAVPVGREVTIDPDTYHVLRHARELGRGSGGAFDIAIASALVSAGLLPSPPKGEHHPATPCGTEALSGRFNDLELLPGHAVRWRKKGCIDLGGIAKGYAVDAAVAALRSHRLTHGLVNAGGDLRCFGGPWPIHVRSVADPTALLAIGSLSDAAIATSAGYFHRMQAGSRAVEPLVDPARGCCVAWDASISVIAAQCMTADALTKVVRLAPASVAYMLDRYDAQAIVLDELGVRTWGRNRLSCDASSAKHFTAEAATA